MTKRKNYRTMQGMFNKAYTGLAAQGFVRSRAGGFCAYAGKQGRACALGHLIPKNKRADLPNISIPSNASWCTARHYEILDAARVRHDDAHVGFTYRLQRAHDGAQSPGHMRRRLRDLAREYKLDIPNV